MNIRTTHFLWTLQGRQQLLQKAIHVQIKSNTMSKQRISECKIEDRNKNIKSQSINEKLQKSQMRLQHTDEQIENIHF